ncbi:beta-1,6-N-acetylglucosaminyltransferase [Roseibacillus ishigakijimensis]|uniref:Uncharacterized protein n=1 Tax=Roseibacillus ishigakijimensis TaxID=454146 RepID=A0A934RUU3_9BACT|nr:beta-1,6-N-acetylglucosaminyltransferase [Roseibacillus ishigakijimensis]MBK1834570.1 hypothetical protein [Roseibacillus ishigakijimensis]
MTHPHTFLINLGRRDDRRGEVEWQLLQAGIEAERFPAIDARFVKSARGYEHKGRYALALTKRLALRAARQRGAKAVLLLEDDVRLHPNFQELVSRLSLPEDWGMCYLGCSHEQKPEIVAPGLARVCYAVDNHALMVNARYYNTLIQALDLTSRYRAGDDPKAASDRILARLQETVPTYAAIPNLAWQAEAPSDLVGKTYTLYTANGTPKQHLALNRQVLNEMVTGWKTPPEPKLGLLFLTRDEVNHPEIWREWVAQAPERVSIWSHPKDPAALAPEAFLADTIIEDHHETAWGDISLVRASLALLKAALADESVTHFALLSESCLPVRPLGEVLRRLQFDPRPQFRPLPWDKSPKRFRVKVAKQESIPPELWRFHAQWWLLDRTCAQLVTRRDYTEAMKTVFAADEGYFGTVLNLEGYPLDDHVLAEDVTWTHWQKDAGSPDSHRTITREHLAAIVSSRALFARKFPPGADLGNYGLHRPF